MARVTDRGQALLVGAVVLAVVFLGLALVINGAIYETTLSTEASEDVAGNDLVTVQDAVRGDVATLIERAVNRTDDYDEQKENVTAMLHEDRVGANYTRHYAERDVLVRVSYNSTTPGRFETGTPDTLSGFSNTRARIFEMDISASSFNASASGPYVIGVSSGHEVRIDDSSIVVANTSASPTTTTDCVTGSTPEYVDLVNGSYRAGSGLQRCPALNVLARTDGDYSVGVSNANRIDGGTYRYLARDSSATEPQKHLYSTSVDLRIHSDSIDYNGTLRVAPGEPR